MDKINKMHSTLKRKYNKSIFIYFGINLITFLFSGALIILNIFAIRKNPADDVTTKWLFISIAIIFAVSAVITSMLSLYVLRNKTKELNEKLIKIKKEKLDHRTKEGEYRKSNKDERLIDNVKRILNS